MFHTKIHNKITIGFYKPDSDFPKICEPDITILETSTLYAMHRASVKAFDLGWQEISGWDYLPLTNDFQRNYICDGNQRTLMVHLFENDICDDQGLIKSIVRDYDGQHTKKST